jgi:hypothetical protein
MKNAMYRRNGGFSSSLEFLYGDQERNGASIQPVAEKEKTPPYRQRQGIKRHLHTDRGREKSPASIYIQRQGKKCYLHQDRRGSKCYTDSDRDNHSIMTMVGKEILPSHRPVQGKKC